MTARYLQPSAPLTGPVVHQHTGRPGEPDAVRVLFADGGWVWMENPEDARALADAFTEAAERLERLHAAKETAA